MAMLCLVAIAVILLRMEWTPACDKVPKNGWESDPNEYNGALPKTNPTTPAYAQPPGLTGPTLRTRNPLLNTGARIGVKRDIFFAEFNDYTFLGLSYERAPLGAWVRELFSCIEWSFMLTLTKRGFNGNSVSS